MSAEIDAVVSQIAARVNARPAHEGKKTQTTGALGVLLAASQLLGGESLPENLQADPGMALLIGLTSALFMFVRAHLAQRERDGELDRSLLLELAREIKGQRDGGIE